MAGSKETPRQKMIGMMYLVLTALLALQVSSAIIQKFQYLNETIQTSRAETESQNNIKFAAIEQEIKERGNLPKEVRLLNNARKLRSDSRKIIAEIESIKKELIDKTGGYDEAGALKGAKEETEVEVLMVGSNKNGKGYSLKTKCDDYVSSVNKLMNKNYGSIALDAWDDPALKENPDQKNKDFAELNFAQTPLVAALTVLSQMQTRITSIETTSLTELANLITIDDFKITKLVPMVKTNTKLVPAGMKYEADLFLTAGLSTLQPQMQLGSTNLTVDSDGIGKINFIASGGNYGPDGTLRKTWTGHIKVKTPKGTDTVYTVTEDYLVVRPDIQIQNASMQNLYYNCGNKISIQVPALGNNFQPEFKAEGAKIIQGAKKGQLMVIPKAGNISLKISSNGFYLGEEKFKVQLLPLPTVEIKANGKKLDPVTGISCAEIRNVTVKALADNNVKQMLPDESNYEITEWKVLLARGKKVVKSKTIVSSQICDLREITDAKPGDRLVVEILSVRRKNFEGNYEVVNIGTKTEVIPLN